ESSKKGMYGSYIHRTNTKIKVDFQPSRIQVFAVHAFLAATMAAVMYAFGAVGNMGGGLLEIATSNWIPLFKYHSTTYLIQWAIGFIFMIIYFFVFRYLILKFNVATPGREADDSSEMKLYTKADYKAKKQANQNGSGNSYTVQALQFLDALGGPENIEAVTNCATRLRVSVNDESKVAPDSVFKSAGAHGVVRNGKAIQVIVGLSVPQVREQFEKALEEKGFKTES
ncbi:glucose PTS transporter subunit EIIB, partial [Geobacillus stearothermophilus]